MIYPKTKKHHCPHKDCRSHKNHKVVQYKAGKANNHRLGKRRYDAKQKGYGGQTKPIFHKKAKTTKKISVKLQCTKCKFITQLCLKRAKHFELSDKKRGKGE
eukprot:TRINITY_DN1103_c0_g1_i1.p3 TRINITY_DN1103_c0_g1~~TRINITY_DN1103_c0_g1_i1.p3  ORF type:complete len:102 (-),score=24.04 TRINITY_DN1103_c0_g1_i1:152-457(-)